MKVLLISVDGMRPDCLKKVPQSKSMFQRASYSLTARTVEPSFTLPCHMSMFHSVDPARHGITTNLYMPQVRPINGLFEQLRLAGKSCAFFYGWEQLRDIGRPSSLAYASFHSEHREGFDQTNKSLTADFIRYYPKYLPDFTFLYYPVLDDVAHTYGWMTPEYFQTARDSWKEINKVLAKMDAVGEEYCAIITSDHGGHDRTHGTLMDEDMTIPIFLLGKPFTPGAVLENVSIKDIAPTVVKLLGATPAPEWEGKSLI